jgi:hypothetical protein
LCENPRAPKMDFSMVFLGHFCFSENWGQKTAKEYWGQTGRFLTFRLRLGTVGAPKRGSV